MAKQFGIIFACLALGELLALIPGLKIPGSIWGMLILTTLLQTKVVKPQSVSAICKFLVSNMAFFFIPPGVALMYYFDLISREWLPIVVATVVSVAIVLIVTGRLHQLLHRQYKKRIRKQTLRKESRNGTTD